MTTPIARRASPSNPCDVCGMGTKGCSVTEDGLHLCRGEPLPGWTRITKEPDAAGFHHYRSKDDRPKPTDKPRAKSPSPLTTDWTATAKRFAGGWREKFDAEFSARLGLPPEAARLYPLLGVDGAYSNGIAMTFPEFDAKGNVVGILVRYPAGVKTLEGHDPAKESKQLIKGGKRGLVLTTGWRDRPGPVLIFDGNTDPIAAAAAGLSAVARVGCEGKSDQIIALFRDLPADREIIVVADNDVKDQGRKGAERLARDVSSAARRPVSFALVPDNAKDARVWFTSPDRGDTPWAERGRLFLDGLRATMKTFDCKTTTAVTPRAGAPVIRVTTHEMEVVDEAIVALARDPELYQRGSVLVRVVPAPPAASKYINMPGGPRIVELKRPTLQERLAHFARWLEETPGAEESHVRDVHPPRWCVDALLIRENYPGIRPLAAVVDHPVLRPDGSVLTAPGYDPDTGLYLSPESAAVQIPDEPSQADAIAAAAELSEVVCDFPFHKDTHKAAWVASLLTPLARFAFSGPAPLFLIDANCPGAGKGLLCNLVSRIVSGTNFAVASYSHDPEEMKKCITATAIAGERLVLFDNLNGAFGNASLDKALTATSWQGRVLGESRNVTLPLWATWYATGNNISLAGDMGRRVVHIRLHSKVENPDERDDFRYGNDAELLTWVHDNRPRLLRAALTILAAYFRAGRPPIGVPRFGSFEGWSGTVRAAVVWAGMADPAGNRAELRKHADPEVAAVTFVLQNWGQVDPRGHGLTASQFVEALSGNSSLTDLSELRAVVGELVKELTPKAISYKFRKYAERPLAGLRLAVSDKTRTGLVRWTVAQSYAGDAGDAEDVYPQGVSGTTNQDCGICHTGNTHDTPRDAPKHVGAGNIPSIPSIPSKPTFDNPSIDLPPPPADPEVEAVLADVLAVCDDDASRNLVNDVRRANDLDRARDLLDGVTKYVRHRDRTRAATLAPELV